MGIHIVYPEDRIVPEDTILTRHADAIANGELPAKSHTEDALKAAQELEHIGKITLGKDQYPSKERMDALKQSVADHDQKREAQAATSFLKNQATRGFKTAQALQEIIKYVEETDWQTHSGEPPTEVQHCVDIAKAAL